MLAAPRNQPLPTRLATRLVPAQELIKFRARPPTLARRPPPLRHCRREGPHLQARPVVGFKSHGRNLTVDYLGTFGTSEYLYG